jgi:hypothetical protein
MDWLEAMLEEWAEFPDRERERKTEALGRGWFAGLPVIGERTLTDPQAWAL